MEQECTEDGKKKSEIVETCFGSKTDSVSQHIRYERCHVLIPKTQYRLFAKTFPKDQMLTIM